MSSNYELQMAVMEGARNASEDAYFGARVDDWSKKHRSCFNAGFERAWNKRQTEIDALRSERDKLKKAEEPLDMDMIMSSKMQEPQIGDKVRATMNGEDWFTGTYVKESDTLAQYGIMRDDIGELRYFVHAEKCITQLTGHDYE